MSAEGAGTAKPVTPTSWHAFDIGTQAAPPGSPGFRKILIDLGLPAACEENAADGDFLDIDEIVRGLGEPVAEAGEVPPAPPAVDVAVDGDTPPRGVDLDDLDLDLDLPPVGARRRAKRKMVCEDQKDEAYKRRRAKNTVYAKRSRDRARAKKQTDEIRLAALAAENDELKARLFELETRLAAVQPPMPLC